MCRKLNLPRVCDVQDSAFLITEEETVKVWAKCLVVVVGVICLAIIADAVMKVNKLNNSVDKALFEQTFGVRPIAEVWNVSNHTIEKEVVGVLVDLSNQRAAYKRELAQIEKDKDLKPDLVENVIRLGSLMRREQNVKWNLQHLDEKFNEACRLASKFGFVMEAKALGYEPPFTGGGEGF